MANKNQMTFRIPTDSAEAFIDRAQTTIAGCEASLNPEQLADRLAEQGFRARELSNALRSLASEEGRTDDNVAHAKAALKTYTKTKLFDPAATTLKPQGDFQTITIDLRPAGAFRGLMQAALPILAKEFGGEEVKTKGAGARSA